MKPSPITWTNYSGAELNFVIRGIAAGDCEMSPGCANCYARQILLRNPSAFSQTTTFREDKLNRISRLRLEPIKRARPMAFVCDMGDLFHPAITDDQIRLALKIMGDRPDIYCQVLTKRAERLPTFSYPHNIWLGVTVECGATTPRIDYLPRTDASIKFLSCEPLLEEITLDLSGIHWVIVGGESGPGRRAPPVTDEQQGGAGKCGSIHVAILPFSVCREPNRSRAAYV